MGVGMPQQLLLNQYGDLLLEVFHDVAYHVGSSLESKTGWRDVDVRLMMNEKKYKKWGFGDPRYPHNNRRWVGLTIAFSLLGQKMTGLPIDFQIQQTEYANSQYPQKARSALFTVRDKK